MKKKLMYEVPEAEQFFVKYEENIMSPNDPTPGSAGGDDDYNEQGDF